MERIKQPGQKLPNLPNSIVILVFGIISIGTCSFIGLAFGIIALVMSKKETALYQLAPDKYSKNSIGMVNTGRTCATIGTILSAIATVFMILYFIILGTLFTSFSGEFDHFIK